MGQYYYIANLDKRQYLHPHKFGDGLKLLEFGCGGMAMTGLAVLLADGNGRGCGDLHSAHPIVGSWAGDRIVIAGDYADPLKFLDGVPRDTLQRIAEETYTAGYQQAERVTLHAYAEQCFEDISDRVLEALADDAYLRQEMRERLKRRLLGWSEHLPLPDSLKQKVFQNPEE